MTLTTERNQDMISGAIGLLVLVALVTVGIKGAFGAFDGGYKVQASFAAAGQGLISGSDVKVRGVDIGEVSSIELVDNRALVTMRINAGRDIPVDAQAVIRPKTLFGEKFVDILPGDDELSGPYLEGTEPEDVAACPDPELPCITDTLGGFELEQVLTDTYPILDALDPMELAVVLEELANAGEGLGDRINRSIVNAATLSELGVSNDAEFRQLTADLALLSEELDRVAPEILRGADALNDALPSLNARSDQLNTALVQLARLSGDLADLLDNNRSFTENALTNGSKTIQLLYDERDQLQPLLVGLERYTMTLAQAIRVEVGDGTLMAAIKNLVSVDQIIDPRETEAQSNEQPAPAPTAPLDDLTGPVTDATEETEDTVDDLLDMLLGGGG